MSVHHQAADPHGECKKHSQHLVGHINSRWWPSSSLLFCPVPPHVKLQFGPYAELLRPTYNKRRGGCDTPPKPPCRVSRFCPQESFKNLTERESVAQSSLKITEVCRPKEKFTARRPPFISSPRLRVNANI